MFDSLQGGYIPICLVVTLVAWFLSGLKPVSARALMSLLTPIVISLLWYFVPDFFRANPDRQDPSWVTWGLIAATAWSAAAIPTSLIAVYLFSKIRKKQAG
jgi:chromate transport protein ChrA